MRRNPVFHVIINTAGILAWGFVIGSAANASWLVIALMTIGLIFSTIGLFASLAEVDKYKHE